MRGLPWVALGAAALALAGCPDGCKGKEADVFDAGVDAGPQELVEQEPNGGPDQALTLQRSARVSASLGADPSKPDEDWYALVSPGVSSADVSVTGIPGGDVALEVYDRDRNRLVAVNSEGEGKPERLPNLTVQGVLYVKVAAAKKGAGGAYTLTALLSEPEPGMEHEPNDRAVDAVALPLGQPISGYLGHASDEDWYRFELAPAEAGAETAPPAPPPQEPVAEQDAGEQAPELLAEASDASAPVEEEVPRMALKLDLTPVPGVRYELTVLSEAEAPLFQVKGKDGEGLSLRNIGVRAVDRTLYVMVKSSWSGTGKDARRGYSADAPYTLTVAQEEAGANAELEPNDELSKATSLPLNGYREGFLSPKQDLDHFVLRTSEPVLAKVQLSGVDRLDLVLSVITPPDASTGEAEKTVLRANDGELKEPEYLNNVRCEGKCYFQVSGALRRGSDGKLVRDYENSESPYRLTVSTVPDTGVEEREPNNNAATATELKLSQPIRGTIQPKKDSDFYRLDLTDRPVRTSLRATTVGILKVDVGLYLHRFEEDGKLSLVQTADRGKGDAPETIRYSAEPGIYLFEVRDTRNREANFQDSYQLLVEEGE